MDQCDHAFLNKCLLRYISLVVFCHLLISIFGMFLKCDMARQDGTLFVRVGQNGLEFVAAVESAVFLCCPASLLTVYSLL